MIKYKTLIVDGSFLAHRSYSANYRLTTDTGLDATMIHGFIRTLNAKRKQFKPDQILIAWESHGTPSWRRQIYPLYKSGRQLNKQFISCQTDLKILLYLLNIKQFWSPNNEADDVIARLTKNSKRPILIYATDKDLMQLVKTDCHMFNGKKIFTPKEVKEKFGVLPEQMIDYLSIVGDETDRIPGIKGFGPKKTAKILEDFNVDEMLKMSYKGGSDLDKYKTKIFFNKRLIKLNYYCDLKEFNPNTKHTIESLLDKYKLKSIKEKIDEYKLMGETKDA